MTQNVDSFEGGRSLAKKNHEGRVFDFHSLRHTFGAWLIQSGANPKEVQRMMRHSDITLTMDTYGHLLPGQEAKAIVQLQGLMGPRTPLIESNKNGLPQTEGKYVSANVSKRSAPRGIPSAIQCSPEGELGPKAKPKKREKTGARSGTRRPATMPCLSEAPLAQLAEQLTLNQLQTVLKTEKDGNSHLVSVLTSVNDSAVPPIKISFVSKSRGRHLSTVGLESIAELVKRSVQLVKEK